MPFRAMFLQATLTPRAEFFSYIQAICITVFYRMHLFLSCLMIVNLNAKVFKYFTLNTFFYKFTVKYKTMDSVLLRCTTAQMSILGNGWHIYS
jgi:hypothetical protein